MAKSTPRPRRARTSASKASSASSASKASRAGKPKEVADVVAAATAPPTDEELDRRDKMKAGPRRAAGPPLEGDHPEAAPLPPLGAELMPDPTDPTR